jgi:Fe2+ or Zn2+ uptake regulation protein
MSDYKSLLKSHKLKVTKARLKLLELLEKQKAPLNIKSIKKALGNSFGDLVTLYRNIESLCKIGLVKEVKLSTKEALYETASRPHHHHIVCESCGKLADVVGSEPKELDKKFLQALGFAKVNFHSLEFYGVCKRCKM